jgi:hypothetical protein
MSEWVEWDAFPDPPKRRRKRIETVTILPPRQPDRTVRVDVHHHRRSAVSPKLIVLGVLLFLAIRFLPALGIGLICILALLIANPIIGIAFASWLVAAIAIMSFAAWRARRAGRPF